MLKVFNIILSEQAKELIVNAATSQGGQWVEKKELRVTEADRKAGISFDPKSIRTRSF